MPTRRIKLPTPTGQWPKPDGYPDLLIDERAIAEHIVSLSPREIDEEMVEECFRGCRARLAWVAIDQITPGHTDTNIANPKREARYAKLPLQTLPPIVIDDGQIQSWITPDPWCVAGCGFCPALAVKELVKRAFCLGNPMTTVGNGRCWVR